MAVMVLLLMLVPVASGAVTAGLLTGVGGIVVSAIDRCIMVARALAKTSKLLCGGWSCPVTGGVVSVLLAPDSRFPVAISSCSLATDRDCYCQLPG